MIIADDLGADIGGWYHDEDWDTNTSFTANIDLFQQDSATFTRKYVQYALCNPSRVSFLTGLRDLRPITTNFVDPKTNFRDTIHNGDSVILTSSWCGIKVLPLKCFDRFTPKVSIFLLFFIWYRTAFLLKNNNISTQYYFSKHKYLQNTQGYLLEKNSTMTMKNNFN